MCSGYIPSWIAKRINLIDEYGTRSICSGKIKQAANHALTLSTPFWSQSSWRDIKKCCSALRSNSLSQKCLSSARWSKHKNTFPWSTYSLNTLDNVIWLKIDVLISLGSSHWILRTPKSIRIKKKILLSYGLGIKKLTRSKN